MPVLRSVLKITEVPWPADLTAVREAKGGFMCRGMAGDESVALVLRDIDQHVHDMLSIGSKGLQCC